MEILNIIIYAINIIIFTIINIINKIINKILKIITINIINFYSNFYKNKT